MKYRRKILSREIEVYLQMLVQQIAEDKGFIIHLFEAGEGYPPLYKTLVKSILKWDHPIKHRGMAVTYMQNRIVHEADSEMVRLTLSCQSK